MQAYNNPIKNTPTPCETFRTWEQHPDNRIAEAGARLRVQWCKKALAIPVLIPLTGFVIRAWREHWPDPATSGALLYDVWTLANYLRSLETRISELESAQGGAQ